MFLGDRPAALEKGTDEQWRYCTTTFSDENHGFIQLGNGRAAHPIRNAVIFGCCKHRISSTLASRRTIHACGLSPQCTFTAVYNAVSWDAVGSKAFRHSNRFCGDVIVVSGCVRA